MNQISPTFEHFWGKKSQFQSNWTNFIDFWTFFGKKVSILIETNKFCQKWTKFYRFFAIFIDFSRKPFEFCQILNVFEEKSLKFIQFWTKNEATSTRNVKFRENNHRFLPTRLGKQTDMNKLWPILEVFDIFSVKQSFLSESHTQGRKKWRILYIFIHFLSSLHPKRTVHLSFSWDGKIWVRCCGFKSFEKGGQVDRYTSVSHPKPTKLKGCFLDLKTFKYIRFLVCQIK